MDNLYNWSLPLLVKIPPMFTAKGSVVASFFLIFFAKFCQVQMQYVLTPKTGYNNVNPRDLTKQDTWQSRAIWRAKSAQDNSWEAFIGFSAAMSMALATGQQESELQFLGNAFIFVRLAYILCYVLAYNAPLSGIRSAIWLVGLGITLRVFSMSCGPIWA